MRLFSLPRMGIIELPTPLRVAENLSRELGGPRILFKRDDLTGLALGGNKGRKLEYLVADAKQQGATVLLTAGAPQSNHCRQTAAAARVANMKCVLIFAPYSKTYGSTDPDQPVQGNLLLDRIFGADIRWYQGEWSGRLDFMQEIADEMSAAGEVPYVIPGGGSNAVGASAYVAAVYEIIDQLISAGESISHFYTTSSTSGGTHAGLAVGHALTGKQFDLVGITCDQDGPTTRDVVVPLANRTAEYLDVALTIADDDLTFVDGYFQPGYGIPNEGCLEAIGLVARTEGILLDPVYTGKTMAALIDHVRSGKLGKNDTVVFHHTGGVPALFAQAENIAGSFSH